MSSQRASATARRKRPLVIGFFLLLAAVVLWATWRVLYPFLTPILLGGMVVVLTHRLYRRLRARLGGRPNLAAVLMLIAVNLLLILPSVVLIILLIQQASSLLELLQRTEMPSAIDLKRFTGAIQRLFPMIDLTRLDLQRQLMLALGKLPAIVAVQGGRVLAGLANVIISYFFMLFAIYYFYTEGEWLLVQIRELSPFPDEYDEDLISKFKSVIDATFRGHVLTALAQGFLTGVGMAIAGIPAAIFWGAVAAVFALLPLVGAAMVWVPAAAYLFLSAGAQGRSIGWGIFMALWGILVVSLIDNVIRPWAMRGGTEMSAVLLLFSVLGGIRAFGFVGMVLGPLAFALLVSVIHMYRNYFQPAEERGAMSDER